MAGDPSPTDLDIGLDDLIAAVRTAAPSGDAIAQLGTAVQIAERLGELGDHLIGHFVDQARASGSSWQAIGAGMGVTKQAAQQRFVPDAGELVDAGYLNRFAPRARAAVDAAREEAKRMGSAQVDTDHLLVAIVAAREALARKALASLGVTVREVRAKVTELAAAPAAGPLPERIPYGPRAKKALEVALRAALRLGHNYIDTEHLLLGIAADPTSPGGRALDALGVRTDAIEDWFQTDFLALVTGKPPA